MHAKFEKLQIELIFDYGHIFTSNMNFVVRFREKYRWCLHEIVTEYRYAIALYNVKMSIHTIY